MMAEVHKSLKENDKTRNPTSTLLLRIFSSILSLLFI